MITIAGSGLGEYDFSKIDIDIKQYELIFCDKNYKTELKNVIKGSFKEIKEKIFQNLDKDILYVVSGSPLLFSGAAIIIAKLKKENIPFKIINNTSSLEYFLTKKGISLTQCGITSLHGKTTVDLEQFLTKPYTFLACDDETPYHLKELLFYLDEDDITIYVGERFGYSDEIIYETTLKNLIKTPPKMPYSLLIKKNYKDLPNISSEETIEHENGMITKSYKRHLSLQNLQLQPNQLLWDIGAGSGSISIDAYKRYKVRTVLFEKNPKRNTLIKNNLKNHKIIDTKLLEGDAKELYKQLTQTPQRIFVGGGGDELLSELAELYNKLDNNGVMVINIVTLKNLNTAINALTKADIDFDIKTISLTTYKYKLLLPEPQRVMHQIIIRKKS
jgi:precorrin-6Y C5,15-methyltransferase (decarboxylating)